LSISSGINDLSKIGARRPGSKKARNETATEEISQAAGLTFEPFPVCRVLVSVRWLLGARRKVGRGEAGEWVDSDSVAWPAQRYSGFRRRALGVRVNACANWFCRDHLPGRRRGRTFADDRKQMAKGFLRKGGRVSLGRRARLLATNALASRIALQGLYHARRQSQCGEAFRRTPRGGKSCRDISRFGRVDRTDRCVEDRTWDELRHISQNTCDFRT